MRDGDRLAVVIDRIEWQDRALVLHYVGRLGDQDAFIGQETRALFVATSAGMRAGQMDVLRAVIESDGKGREGQ